MQANSGELFKIFSILDIWEQTSGARIVGQIFCLLLWVLFSVEQRSTFDR